MAGYTTRTIVDVTAAPARAQKYPVNSPGDVCKNGLANLGFDAGREEVSVDGEGKA
jgi:hypothetical protein